MTRTIDHESAPSADETLAEPSFGKRIMVVEDDPGLVGLYRILLHARGYRVITAEDGEEALATFEREGREGREIDLLIADVGLPRVGVVEMLARMKTGGLLPRVLICSGGVGYETECELREAGVSWFLSKPFRNREMLSEVERILLSEPAGTS